MIYVNGDSYSITNGKNYGDYLSESTGNPLLHKGIPGSSNSRIFRTTARDLLKLKQQGVTDCSVIVGLSFWFRTELWIDEHGIDKWYQHSFDDGEFASFQAVYNNDWFTKGPTLKKVPKEYQAYLREWVLTRNTDAVFVDIMHQASLLKHLCNSLGYKFIIFWSADVTEDTRRIDPNLDALKDFYAEFDQSNSFNLLDYSFSNYYNNIRKPYDFELYGNAGHPDTQSHAEFAQELVKKLEAQNV